VYSVVKVQTREKILSLTVIDNGVFQLPLAEMFLHLSRVKTCFWDLSWKKYLKSTIKSAIKNKKEHDSNSRSCCLSCPNSMVLVLTDKRWMQALFRLAILPSGSVSGG